MVDCDVVVVFRFPEQPLSMHRLPCTEMPLKPGRRPRIMMRGVNVFTSTKTWPAKSIGVRVGYENIADLIPACLRVMISPNASYEVHQTSFCGAMMQVKKKK